MSDVVEFSVMGAIDVLDALSAGQAPEPAQVLRAALVLALFTSPSDEFGLAVVHDLEKLVLSGPALDANGRERIAQAASALRQHVGVH